MFTSINFTQIRCIKCGTMTQIEPGVPFKELSCKCNTEVAKQFKQIKEYTSKEGATVELIGEFTNGDVEIKYPDGSLSYRVSAKTFNKDFKEITDEPKNNTDEVILSIEQLIGLDSESIKEQYTVDALRVLAKSVGIKGFSRMGEQKLIDKLLEKVK